MRRIIGTNAMGLRMPVVKQGDNLVEIIADKFAELIKTNSCEVNESDIIGVTESLLARAQGNYVDLDVIKKDVDNKFKNEINIVSPILSRNRFSNILKAIALTGKKINIYLSYPSDEVGNAIMDKYEVMRKKINIYEDTLTEEDYNNLFGDMYLHPFTHVNYVDLYKSFAVNDNITVYFSNNLDHIAKSSDEILIANIHDEAYLKEFFKNNGVSTVYSLRDLMNESIDGSGYNNEHGLYGSNLATGNSLKLFPRDSREFVYELQKAIADRVGVNVQVLVYGDGAFKDPAGKIWELADPVVSPGFTDGLKGLPNEIKFKYVADNELKDLSGQEADDAMKKRIAEKNLEMDTPERLGTTPRQLTDLIGSLCDLTSGSGDKGTPIILVQGYFDNYTN